MRTEEQVLKEEEVKELAEAHWDWLSSVLETQRQMERQLFIDAFVHGFKHGSTSSPRGRES